MRIFSSLHQRLHRLVHEQTKANLFLASFILGIIWGWYIYAGNVGQQVLGVYLSEPTLFKGCSVIAAAFIMFVYPRFRLRHDCDRQFVLLAVACAGLCTVLAWASTYYRVFELLSTCTGGFAGGCTYGILFAHWIVRVAPREFPLLIFELSLASIIMIICYFLLIALPTFAAPWIALGLPLTAGMIALSPTNTEEREASPKAAAKQTPSIPLFVASILLSGGISKTLLTNNWVAADSFGWLWATIPLGIALCLLSVFASAKNAPIITYSFLSSFISFVVLCALFLPSQHFSLAGLMFASAWFLLVYTIASSIWLGGLHSTNPSVFACAIIGWFFFLTEATAYFTKFFPMHDTSLLIIAVVLLMISLALMMIASSLQATRSDNNGTASSLKNPEETDIIEHCRAIAGQYGLTEREYDVLTLLAKGNSLKSIAEKLIVSENTVKSHRRHVYQKLGINSRQSLIDMIERN